MLMIPVLNKGRVDLLIVLEDDNIERIKQYDPAEVKWSQIPWPDVRPRTIGIGYATAEEIKKIHKLAEEGKPQEAIKLVTRGFKFRPERGDHDFGPISLGRKGN